MKVLYADDNEELRELISPRLRYLGYEVTECANTKEAKIRIETQEFDYLILDNNLTGDTGIQGGLDLAEYRKETRNANTPTMILTGDGSQPDFASRAAAAGITITIIKATHRFIDAVAAALETERLQLSRH